VSPDPAVLESSLRRWLVALEVLLAAEGALRRGGTTAPTVAVILGDTAAETLLGVLSVLGGGEGSGKRQALQNEATKAVRDAGGTWPAGLGADLNAAHGARNGAVHQGVEQTTSAAATAISAARRLLDLLPVVSAAIPGADTGTTLIGAVAALVGAAREVSEQIVEAERELTAHRLGGAADAGARALYLALQQSTPLLRQPLAAPPHMADAGLRAYLQPITGQIDRIDAWLVPMALGLQPVAYARMVAVLGSVVETLSGQMHVQRRDEPRSVDEVRWTLEQLVQVIFRLWTTGSMYVGTRDEYLEQRFARRR